MTNGIGRVIREVREARGWSQEQLAEKVGATQSTIDRIESGKTRRSGYIHTIVMTLGLIDFTADEYKTDVEAEYKSKEGAKLQKATFLLPSELISRMKSYRRDYDLVSDDEAAKQLIEEGLMQFDHFISITNRLHKLIKEGKSLHDAARRILGNHTSVFSVIYNTNSVKFTLKDKFTVEVFADGTAIVWDESGELYEFSVGDEPEWASPANTGLR